MNKDSPALMALSRLFDTAPMTSVLPSLYETDGFIFAVAASPEIPMPERWMPQLINASHGGLNNHDVDNMADAFMACLRCHLDAMRHDEILLPLACRWHENESEVPTALRDWLKGLLRGHQQAEKDWQQAWSQAAGDEETQSARLQRSLRLFSTLADVGLAMEMRNAQQQAALQENLPLLWRQLPMQLQDYVALAGELAEALPNQFETFSRAADDAD
ncbi:UPF0149 family protein [Alteromonas sp. CYL-A6]|uniref:UPF0149 family protein n=1 Tax=Alteromonas nitratireducens TaxID=3390813 RepID=UPI0034B01C4F